MRRARKIWGAVAAAVLLCTAPVLSFAATSTQDVLPFDAGVDELADRLAPAESEPEPIPGQALVLYRVDADAASARSLSADDADGAPLADEGFSVASTWDFSVVDEQLAAQPSAFSASPDDAESVEDATSSIPAGEDVRIALVKREGADPWDLVEELEQLDCVIAAQPNYVARVSSATPTNDALADWCYDLYDESAGIDFDAVLEQQVPSDPDEAIVAVIDTGVDGTHPDLVNQMWHKPEGLDALPGAAGSTGYDFVCNDDDPTPGAAMVDSHGTHCAGIIAATADNEQGIAGVADVQIMAFKDTEDNGGGYLSELAVMNSYQYLIAARLAGQNVIAVNCSWSLGPYNPVLDYLINQAGRLGIVSLCAAGNDTHATSDISWTNNSTAGLQSPYAIVIASTNTQNELSSFSNWDETQVDLAFPGSLILSTVSTSGARAFFDARIAHESGEELLYYRDFSDAAQAPGTYELIVYDLVEDKLVESNDFVSLEAGEYEGEPSLDVVIDLAKVPEGPVDRYQIRVAWQMDNVFRDAGYDASELGVTVTPFVDAKESPRDTTVYAYPSVKSDEIGYLTNSAAPVIVAEYDNSAIYGDAFAQLDTTSDALNGVVNVFVLSEQTQGTARIHLTGFGIGVVAGEESDYAPYGLMSGTSMATPLAAGSYARLAALYPDETPLELRGRLVGATEDVVPTYDAEGEERLTATDGRFSFDVALNDDALSANTWSIDVDPATGEATLRGRALDGAQLLVDGAPLEATPSEDGSELACTLPADVLDGAEHRFDVRDASTQRVHRASYTVPLAEEEPSSTALVYELGLPEGFAGAPRIAAGPDRIFLTDQQASCLYAHAWPAHEGDEWVELATPPALTGDDLPVYEFSCSFAYFDGALYTVCVCDDATAEDGLGYVSAFVARYDIGSNTWGAFELAGTAPSLGINAASISCSTTTSDGALYVLVAQQLGSKEDIEAQLGTCILSRIDASGDISEVPNAFEGGTELVRLSLASHDGTLSLLAYDPAQEELCVFTLDEGAGAWRAAGAVSGAPRFSFEDIGTAPLAAWTPTDAGWIVTGVPLGASGDTALIAPSEDGGWAWTGLGTLGTSASEGISVSSVAMADGDVLLAGVDNRAAGGAGAGIWSVPDELSAQAGTFARTARARATAGGTATVSDWRGGAAGELVMRRDDTATWTATPHEGYAFAGWYDAAGALVSQGARCETPVTDDTTLEARFTATGTGGGTGGGTGETDDDTTSGTGETDDDTKNDTDETDDDAKNDTDETDDNHDGGSSDGGGSGGDLANAPHGDADDGSGGGSQGGGDRAILPLAGDVAPVWAAGLFFAGAACIIVGARFRRCR